MALSSFKTPLIFSWRNRRPGARGGGGGRGGLRYAAPLVYVAIIFAFIFGKRGGGLLPRSGVTKPFCAETGDRGAAGSSRKTFALDNLAAERMQGEVPAAISPFGWAGVLRGGWGAARGSGHLDQWERMSSLADTTTLRPTFQSVVFGLRGAEMSFWRKEGLRSAQGALIKYFIFPRRK